MLYLDSSALVKLVVPEPESRALQARLALADHLISSVVAAIEVPRAVARVADRPATSRRVDEVLSAIDLRDLGPEVVSAARAIPAHIRSLDAIHLGTALAGDTNCEVFVAYDRRLQHAARELGLPVLAPGA